MSMIAARSNYQQDKDCQVAVEHSGNIKIEPGNAPSHTHGLREVVDKSPGTFQGPRPQAAMTSNQFLEPRMSPTLIWAGRVKCHRESEPYPTSPQKMPAR